MSTERNQLFRKSALDRLSSPNLLDERLILASYRPWLRIALPALLVLVLSYLAWIASVQ